MSQAHHLSFGDSDAERQYLVRLCAYLSGSVDVAEGLAQETLIEAWRHEDSLRDASRRSAWLSGLARNVCRRWWRAQARHLQRQGDACTQSDAPTRSVLVADDLDVEEEPERAELALLLDRAMSLLSPTKRDVLVARFVDDLTHEEIADQLRLSQGTVKVRVHRGKLALRRLLASEFADELDAYGFTPMDEEWRETKIWCAECGTHRLHMRVAQPPDTLSFRCPHCHPDPSVCSSAS